MIPSPPAAPTAESSKGSSSSRNGQPTTERSSEPATGHSSKQPQQRVRQQGGWERFQHLNSKDVYFFSAARNMITPDDVNIEEDLAFIEQPVPCPTSLQALEKLRRIVRKRSGAPVLETVYLDWVNQRAYGDISEEFQTLSENAQFWTYVKAYPMHHPQSLEVVHAMNSVVAKMVVPYVEQVVGNDDTNSILTEDQFERMIKLYHQLSAIPSSEQGLRNWLLASLALEIDSSRAKLTKKTHPTSGKWYTHLQDTLFSVFLLGSNLPYREALASFSAGSSSTEKLKFQKIMKGFLQEWADTNLLATVLLSCGVAFLSISDVDGVQKTVIIMSTILSLASILTGVLHVRQHKAKVDSDLAYAWNYLHRGLGGAMDVTLLSSILALPYAILLWSLLSFVVGIFLHAFEDTSMPDVDFGRPLLGVISGLILLIIAFCFCWDTRNRRPKHQASVTVAVSGKQALPKGDRCTTGYWGFVTRALRRWTSSSSQKEMTSINV